MTPLEQITEARNEAKAQVELASHLDKLRKNRSFNKVIEEYVFKDLAVTMAAAFATPGMSPTAKESVENTLTAISVMKNVLSTIYTKADAAEVMLLEIDEAEAEFLAEGSN
jgi:ethanolamine utilization microcompartment shell protein EutS